MAAKLLIEAANQCMKETAKSLSKNLKKTKLDDNDDQLVSASNSNKSTPEDNKSLERSLEKKSEAEEKSDKKIPKKVSKAEEKSDKKTPKKGSEGEEKSDKKKLKKESESQTKMDKNKIEKWVRSIRELLEDPDGFTEFRIFLEGVEKKPGQLTRDLDFWKECEEFTRQFMLLENKAKDIFDIYLDTGATCALDDVDGDEVGDKLEDEEGFSDKHLFVSCQDQVLKRLSQVQYVNFVKHLREKYQIE